MVSKESRSKVRAKKHMRIRNRFSGTAERPRLAVFRSNNHVYAQVIDDVAGKTIVSASTLEKDIKAELKNGYLVVSAEHTETKEMSENTASKAPEGEEKEAEAKEAEAKEAEVVDEPKYVVRERFYGRFERSFYVGKDIAKDDIKAAFSNGLLTLTVPKSVKKPEPEQEYISITD